MSNDQSAAQAQLREDLAQEPHYSVIEIARMWNLSEQIVRKIFEHEPGVLVITGKAKFSRRAYRTFRVPATVVRRKHKELSEAG
jgi:hypothetical protein